MFDLSISTLCVLVCLIIVDCYSELYLIINNKFDIKNRKYVKQKCALHSIEIIN